MTEESDGLDDAEFLDQHEQYIHDSERRRIRVLKFEEERQAVFCSLPSLV